MVIWYILGSFGIFWVRLVDFPVLVCFTKKNLATLFNSRRHETERKREAVLFTWDNKKKVFFCFALKRSDGKVQK
jgi:hypothetical protein